MALPTLHQLAADVQARAGGQASAAVGDRAAAGDQVPAAVGDNAAAGERAAPDAAGDQALEAGGGPAPAAQLLAAIELAAELTDLGDALIGRFVARARDAGLSWTEIGQAFGTSKQAVQQRYGAGAAMWPGRWTPAARDALERARDEARALGHDYVGTEHALLALAGHGITAEVLSALGVTRERMLATPCLQPTPGDHRVPQALMPRFKQALEHARRIADGLGAAVPATEHLLAGIVSVPDSMAVEILRRLKVSTDAVRRARPSRSPSAPSGWAPLAASGGACSPRHGEDGPGLHARAGRGGRAVTGPRPGVGVHDGVLEHHADRAASAPSRRRAHAELGARRGGPRASPLEPAVHEPLAPWFGAAQRAARVCIEWAMRTCPEPSRRALRTASAGNGVALSHPAAESVGRAADRFGARRPRAGVRGDRRALPPTSLAAWAPAAARGACRGGRPASLPRRVGGAPAG